jgi:uncharacterized protein
MKKRLLPFALLSLFAAQAQQKDYPIQTVDFTKVKVTDHFWAPRMEINRTVTIPASFERCESTGRIKNFEMAAAHSGKFCTTFPFDDTDIYKTLEGASYSLSVHPDTKMAAYLDTLIVKIGKAQEPDGYLYTARTIDPEHPHAWAGKTRWERERELSHELYNAGHLYEAAAAHYYATGKKTLLNIALKNADLVCSVFGPGKRAVAPGHEIVEMGLVKLYRITGKPEYLATAKFFIDQRGHYTGYDTNNKDMWKNGAYWQDNVPVTQQTEAEGHAVRAGYLYSGMADVAALTGDTAYLRAVDSIWQNMVSKKIYVQGGLGALPGGEAFGANYELPNTTAYNETCAAIANVYWNYRMFLLHGDSKYFDVLEKTLYNGLISGEGLDGKSFFYSNAMQIRNSASYRSTEPTRSGWFECSCCPTNLTRLLPSVPGYVYAQKGSDVYVNLFVAGNASLMVNKTPLSITQTNNYPWDGALQFAVAPQKSTAFSLKLRLPGWAQNEAIPSSLYAFADNAAESIVIKVNGEPVKYTTDKGYAVLNRTWKRGDVVIMDLPMPVRKVVASDMVKNDAGKVALQRGPLVYCAEWVDNGGKAGNIIVPQNASFSAAYRPDLLNGLTVITAQLPVVEVADQSIRTETKTVTAIPYFAWANRGKGEMTVWFPSQVKDIDFITAENKEAEKGK